MVANTRCGDCSGLQRTACESLWSTAAEHAVVSRATMGHAIQASEGLHPDVVALMDTLHGTLEGFVRASDADVLARLTQSLGTIGCTASSADIAQAYRSL